MSDLTLRPSPRTVSGDTDPTPILNSPGNGLLKDFSETLFLRSWFELEAKTQEGFESRNRGRFLGLMLVLGISAGFWTGVGLLVAHLVR